MKKAFTLVELLAVIAILGVVIVIAIPSVKNAIETSYEKTYEYNLERLQSAAKDYFIDKGIRLDNAETRIVNITEMIDENYLKEIKDPDTKETCEGFVTITKSNRNYLYDSYLKCGDNYVSDNYDDIVKYLPVITILGNNPVNININDSYLDAGSTAKDYYGIDVTNSIVVTSNLDTSIPGAYTVTYTAMDGMGNQNTANRVVNVIDNIAPTITFNPTSNSTYASSRDTVVKVNDIGGLNESSLKYVWTTSTTQPSASLLTSTYKNNQPVTTPSNVGGIYYLWATASDNAGNIAVKNSGAFYIDNISPIIAVTGSNPATVSKGSTYSDAGASATDNLDTGLTVTSSGTVNPNIVGTYIITYTATDSCGNKGMATRTVNVIDTTAPVITLNGSNPTNINVNSTYADAGSSAIDDVDGDVTSKITTTGTVNPSVVGTYTITYTVKDSSNNTATKTRTVNVIDNIAPTVAFGTNGNSTYAKSRSTTVTVSDAHTGVNTSSLKYQWTTSTTAPTEASFTTAFTNAGTISSPVGVTGGYYLWILAKDTAGNTLITKTNVFNLDNIVPVITLNGSTPVNVNVGGTYTDAGATATDNISTGLTPTATSTVNINALGSYTVTYNVSDGAGNVATSVVRTVNVIDSILPTVAFGTNGNATYAKARSTTATISDNVAVNTSSLKYQWTTSTTTPTEASFTTAFTNAGTISSPAGVTGGYYLWILAKDTSGNTLIARTNVFNLDNTKPIITMTGSATVTVNRGSTYSDAGATATDAHSGINGSVTATGTVNPSIVGTYTITYNVNDKAGNAATPVVRTINVVDVLAPVITMLGSNPVNINVNGTYADAGSSALDDVDGDVTSRITTTGTVNPSVVGTYTITYTVKDNANNTAISTRTVNVLDNISPTVAFGTNGNVTYAKTRSTTVTISDNVAVNTSSLKYQWNTSTTAPTEASFTTTFTNGGTLSTPAGVTGGYYLWILAKDTAGNTLITKTNIFNLDNIVPIITMNGISTVTINVGSTYADAGATATDNISTGLTPTATSTVNTSVVGSYTVTYSVSDGVGNAATSVVRTVNVVDTVAPTVTFGTNGNSTYAKSYSTTVTLSDNYSLNTSSLEYQWTTSTTAPTEASFTTTFTNGGTLSTPAVVTGGYYLWILGKDTSGNTLIARTNVFNLDNTAPSVPTSEVRYGSSTGTIRSNSDTSWSKQTLWWGNFSATDATSGVSSYQYSTSCTGTSSGTLGSSYTYSNNNYTFCIRAIDTAGNTSAWSTSTYIKADTTVPSVPTSEVRYGSSTGTIRSNSDTSWSKQTLWWGKFSATDATSGVSSYQYSTGCTGTSSGTLSSSYTYSNNNYTLCIRAIDTAGNISAWSTSTYIKADTTVPVISMNGSSPVTIYVGDTYTDTGATATDNLSGLSGSVTSTGTVNPSVAGTYTITYNVSDNAGNAATTVTRTVTVQANGPQYITACTTYATDSANTAASAAHSTCISSCQPPTDCSTACSSAGSNAYSSTYQPSFISCCSSSCGGVEACVAGCASDYTAPTVSAFTATSTAAGYNSLSVTLSISAYDTNSGVSKMYISNTGYGTGGAWETYATSKSWTLPGSYDGGTRTIYLQVKDVAGNIATRTVTYTVATAQQYTDATNTALFETYRTSCIAEANAAATSAGNSCASSCQGPQCGSACSSAASSAYSSTINSCCSNASKCGSNSTCLNICLH